MCIYTIITAIEWWYISTENKTEKKGIKIQKTNLFLCFRVDFLTKIKIKYTEMSDLKKHGSNDDNSDEYFVVHKNDDSIISDNDDTNPNNNNDRQILGSLMNESNSPSLNKSLYTSNEFVQRSTIDVNNSNENINVNKNDNNSDSDSDNDIGKELTSTTIDDVVESQSLHSSSKFVDQSIIMDDNNSNNNDNNIETENIKDNNDNSNENNNENNNDNIKEPGSCIMDDVCGIIFIYYL